MKNKRRVFLLCMICFLFHSSLIFSQDTHFSQFLSSPLNLNPALTGYMEADDRFILNQRTQWASVSVPYRTYSASFDMKLQSEKRKSNDFFGFGFLLNYGLAGDGHLGTTQFSVLSSYIKPFDRNNRNVLSAGIQVSFMEENLNPNAFMFGNQFDGDQYNSSLNNGESFLKNDIKFFDFASGINYHFSPSSKINLSVGISLYHINEPTETFYLANSYLPRKLILYGASIFKINESIALSPSFYVSRQEHFQESTMGAIVRFYFNKKNNFKIGIFNRFQDAIFIFTGIEYSSWDWGLSYDITTSELSSADRTYGAIEISLAYLLRKEKLNHKSAFPCPAFM